MIPTYEPGPVTFWPELLQLMVTVRRSIVRLEQQPAYAADFDDPERFYTWLDGRGTRQDFTSWTTMVEALADRDVSMARVRVHEDPPTDVNRFSRWNGEANEAAGERMIYVSRPTVDLSAVGSADWWLFDDETVLEMRFDSNGGLIEHTTTTDPTRGQNLRRIWDSLAGHSAVTAR